MTFSVVTNRELPPVDLHVELGYDICPPLSGCNCWIGVTGPFQLTPGQARTLQVEVSAEPHPGRPCSFPTRTSSIGARIVRSPTGAGPPTLFERRFDVSYTINP